MLSKKVFTFISLYFLLIAKNSIFNILFFFSMHNMRKRKSRKEDTLQALENNLASRDISPTAKSNLLKEIRQENSTLFSKNWFLEYWQGERSIFYAFFTWFFCVPFIPRWIFGLIGDSIYQSYALYDSHLFDTLVAGLFMAYFALVFVIIWRCSNNSRTVMKWIMRGFFTINEIFYIIIFTAFLVSTINIA